MGKADTKPLRAISNATYYRRLFMISPVIEFNGNCAKAIEFYEKVFGATDKYIDYYHEAPDDSGIPNTGDTKNWVMHSGITICGTHFNMSDSTEPIVPGNMYKFNVFMDSEQEVTQAYDMLKVNGEVVVELGPQFFSPMYGSVKDCFGVRWQLIMNEKKED